MKEPKFKQGEWCFCEFTLKLVKETKEDRITSVSDGYFEHGSYDLSDRCYPLTLEIKRISDEVNYWSKKFHELKNNSLNHPDLNRELISRWVEMCEAKDDHEKLRKLFDSLSEFGTAVITKVRDLGGEEVQGVRIFR